MNGSSQRTQSLARLEAWGDGLSGRFKASTTENHFAYPHPLFIYLSIYIYMPMHGADCGQVLCGPLADGA